jgi:hypothetical protein
VTVINPDARAAEKMDELLGSGGSVLHFSSLADFVDARCPRLVRWKVYVAEDERLGLQVDLFVDGADMISDIDRLDPPWDRFDETAVSWVDSLLDSVDPRIREQAVLTGSGAEVRVSAFSAMARGQTPLMPEDVSRFAL